MSEAHFIMPFNSSCKVTLKPDVANATLAVVPKIPPPTTNTFGYNFFLTISDSLIAFSVIFLFNS